MKYFHFRVDEGWLTKDWCDSRVIFDYADSEKLSDNDWMMARFYNVGFASLDGILNSREIDLLNYHGIPFSIVIR